MSFLTPIRLIETFRNKKKGKEKVKEMEKREAEVDVEEEEAAVAVEEAEVELNNKPVNFNDDTFDLKIKLINLSFYLF